jgi:hypothetical protein
MDTSAIVTLVGSTASAVATVILAFLTSKYVRLTHALVEETRSAKFPNVFVDVEFDDMGVKFLAGNAGNSPALNVQFKVEDSVPWRKTEGYPTGIQELSIVKNGISYLAPNRTLKFFAGYVERNPAFFASGSAIVVSLTFETEAGTKVTRDLSIDFSSYAGVLFESFTHPEREVAKAIRDAESHRSSRDPIRSIVNRISRHTCPSCGELISPKAKKCPQCHEYLPEASETNGP